MPQTPISASVVYNSTTPTTIYTVPAGATAVVKGILAASEIGGFNTVTVNKVSGGLNYAVVVDQPTGYLAASGTYFNNPGIASVNLLKSPITLAAGDSISISTSSTSYYRVENTTTATNYKIGNFRYLNGYYIAVGLDNNTGLGLILTSTDGITYTQRTFTASVSLTNVVYGNGYYVVCNSTGGTIHYSTDLNTWTSANLPSVYACYGLVYGGTTFVVGGTNGEHARASTTPVTWTAGTVQRTDTINDINYIGTNFLFLTSSISFYTADFSTYTLPYTSTLSSATQPYSIAAGSTGYYVTNNLAPSTNPNTFLRVSSNALTWSARATVANSVFYGGNLQISSLGGFAVFPYYHSGGINTPYLYSSDGTTWTAGNYTGNGANQAGYKFFQFNGYHNTANTNYRNKGFALIQDTNSNQDWFNQYDTNASGTFGSHSNSFSASTINDGTMVTSPGRSMPVCGNPFDGTWRSLVYYSNGGTYGGSGYYGSSPSNGSNSYQVTGWYNNQGQGYGTCISCLPNSNVYFLGSSSGWVFRCGTYNQSPVAYFGPAQYVSNPPGFTFVSSTVVGMARGGETSTSPFVIIWDNGNFATTTNQGASWTYGNIGFGSINTQNNLYGSGPIVFGNGNFVVVNLAGQVAISANGTTWSAEISNVNSGYFLNSQNVFITNSGIFTSASTTVDSFTYKSNPSGIIGNPTVRRMAYANSTYYLYGANTNTLLASSDLITWTSRSFVQPTLNNKSFFAASYGAIAYSGSGTTIAVSAGRDSMQLGSISQPFNPSSSIYVGSATAAIVQIT